MRKIGRNRQLNRRSLLFRQPADVQKTNVFFFFFIIFIRIRELSIKKCAQQHQLCAFAHQSGRSIDNQGGRQRRYECASIGALALYAICTRSPTGTNWRERHRFGLKLSTCASAECKRASVFAAFPSTATNSQRPRASQTPQTQADAARAFVSIMS